MTEHEFNQEMLCHPLRSLRGKSVDVAIRAYYKLTDAFDAKICTGAEDAEGHPQPAEALQRKLINNYALGLRARMTEEFSIPERDFQEALHRHR
ncbi:MAG TPA: hypothetical protein ENH11_06550 [Candidatus Acetothermia bacterium]|nr:hypothetical protein [Candidatus Acetothermia bacterium]